MGRRPRDALPVKRINIIVGDELIVYELDALERLENRRMARMRMRDLRPKADAIIHMQEMARPPVPETRKTVVLSMRYVNLYSAEDMDSGELPSCVSLVDDRLTVSSGTHK